MAVEHHCRDEQCQVDQQGRSDVSSYIVLLSDYRHGGRGLFRFSSSGPSQEWVSDADQSDAMCSWKKTGFSTFEYQHEVFQGDALLVETNTRSNLETVLGTVRAFKQKWHQNDKKLLVSFVACQSTGLCPDVLFERGPHYLFNQPFSNASWCTRQTTSEQSFGAVSQDDFWTSRSEQSYFASFDSFQPTTTAYDWFFSKFATQRLQSWLILAFDIQTWFRFCRDRKSVHFSLEEYHDQLFRIRCRTPSIACYRLSSSHLVKAAIKYIQPLVSVQRHKGIHFVDESLAKAERNPQEERTRVRQIV